MKNNELIVECKKVKFYASYDEDAFFEWIAKIKSVTLVKGKGSSIFLTVQAPLLKEDLYNANSIFKKPL